MRFSDTLASPSIRQVRIDHGQGQFQYMEQGEWFPLAANSTSTTILLAGVNQRQYWRDDLNGYVCASHDAVTGVPRHNFPWKETGFVNTAGTLECSACPFSKWTPGPGGRNIPPVCGDKIMLIFLAAASNPDELELCGLPLSFSARKPLQSYLSRFSESNTPLFSSVTRLTVNINLGTKGRRYAVPAFAELDPVSTSLYPFLMDLSVRARALAVDPPPPPKKSGGFFGGGPATPATHSGSFFNE